MRVPFHQQKKRLFGLRLTPNEIDCRIAGFVVDGFHALFGKRSGVLDSLLPNLSEARVDGLILLIGGHTFEHPAWAEFSLERRIFGIVGPLGLFFGIQMIKVAEELIQPMHRRQELVAVAEMVLAELTGGIAERLQSLRDGDVLGEERQRRRWDADFRYCGS